MMKKLMLILKRLRGPSEKEIEAREISGRILQKMWDRHEEAACGGAPMRQTEHVTMQDNIAALAEYLDLEKPCSYTGDMAACPVCHTLYESTDTAGTCCVNIP